MFETWDRYVSRHRKSRSAQWLVRRCKTLIHTFENVDNWDPTRNGELVVLERLRGMGLTCLLDVGANVGEWADMARRVFPDATIHCFEILDDAFRELESKFASCANVVVNDRGLLDEAGEVPVVTFPQHNVLTTTLAEPGHPFESERTSGRVTTGDIYIREAGIEHIDYVKIDVEGADHQVLFGFADAIRDGRIDAFQFEYGQVSIVTKFLLSDFYDFFMERGFVVGKIYPEGVAFREYDRDHETFGGSNFIAVRAERADWIELLSLG